LSKKYTNMFEIIKDVEAYSYLRHGRILNLSHIQPIAQNRWTWFVSNWNSLFDRFKRNANGNSEILDSLSSMNREVQSYNLGNINNPLEVLSRTIEFDPFISQITLSELNLTPDELSLRDSEKLRLISLDIENFQQMVDFIKQRASIFSQEVGLGDATTSAIYGAKVQTPKRSANVSDITTIKNFNLTKKYITGILYDLKTRQKVAPNLIKIANNNIEPGSQVVLSDVFKSYVAVPFQISIQHMAKLHLGDVNLWFELATINNLQPPYVDEAGTKLPLLAPAAVNNLIISSSLKEYLYVGIKIAIGSFKVKEESRIIEKIIVNENNTMVIFVSGKQDLNKFKSSERAFVRVFQPNTIRTNDFILIPSTNDGTSTRPAPTPSNDSLRRLEKAYINFGIDVYRDIKTGDFVLDSSGNFKKAAGTDAIRQAVLYILKTSVGELPFHPDFGVSNNIGERFYGTKDEALEFSETLRSSIMNDDRFESVIINKLSTTGTGIALSLLVNIRGLREPITLSFIS